MKNQRFVTVSAAAALCVCMILAAHQRWQFPLVNEAVNTVLLPFNDAVRSVSDTVSAFRESQRLNATLQEENRRLKAELDSLRGAEYRLKLLEMENQDLQALAGFKQRREELVLLPARALGISLGDLHEYFFLDKGKADGLREDMVVLSGDGVAGVVDQVYGHYSRFMLISSNQSRMGVKVLRRGSRAVGVLTGQGTSRSLLQAEYFSRDDDVVVGDMLVTSGIGGKYPAGLYVGKVSAAETDATGLQKLVTLVSAANLNQLDRVYVVLQEDVKRRIEKEIEEAKQSENHAKAAAVSQRKDAEAAVPDKTGRNENGAAGEATP